jgi:sugar (pentulose or hexulose) kinase
MVLIDVMYLDLLAWLAQHHPEVYADYQMWLDHKEGRI